MRTKFSGFLTLLIALIVQVSFAQEKTVTGVVKDQDGLPLPGANVVVKGTSTGTQTDFDGIYSIQASTGDVLVYSFVGQTTEERTVGASNSINVTLAQDATELEAVVVNALGIEVNRGSLASSISEVDAGAIQNSGETSIAKGLSGKASGVQIINTSGDAGSSAYIQIRGQSTITRSLQPLIVVDGIPISNDEIGGGVDGVVQQSRIGDINPNDIESLEVLKGASAAALWGSRAGNGVIVITTKKGKGVDQGDLKVSISTTYSHDEPNDILDTQDIFGRGSNGIAALGTSANANSWGDKISERPGGPDFVDSASPNYFVARDGDIYYPITEKRSRENFNDSNYEDVINSGYYLENNVSFSGATKSGNYFMSVSNLDQEGIVRSNDYNRTTARLNSEFRLNDRIKFKGTATYSNITSNRIQQGSNTSGLLLGLYRTPADFDNSDYIGTRYANGIPVTENSHRAYRRQLGTVDRQSPIYNNPLWTTDVQQNPNTVDRFILGGTFEAEATDWLKLIARGGVDHYVDERMALYPVNSAENNGQGSFNEQLYASTQTNIDFIGTGNFDITEKLNFNYLAGLNFNKRRFEQRGGSYVNFILDTDKIFYENAIVANRRSTIDESEVRISAGYANVAFDYDNLLYLSLTGRAETASTFGDNEIFYYPSAEFGFSFANLVNNQQTFSKGKLRLTYGEVGIEPAAYATTTYYSSAAGAEGYGPAYDSGAYDGSFVRSAFEGNSDLQPERKKEFEVGVDLGFFSNRLTLNATYYSNETEGALFTVARPGSTGFAGRYANAASLENKGFEIDFSFDIIRSADFTWNLYGNWSRNRNEVTRLTGTESLFLNGFAGTSSRAVEGEPVGVLWGGRYQRNDDGSLALDSNGFPTVAPTEGVIGDPNPDWRGGLGTSFRYKGLTVSTLFDASVGGDIWDGTNGALTVFGRTPITANEVTVSAADAATINNISGTTINNISYANQNSDGSYTVRGNLEDFGAGTVLLDQPYYSGIGGGFGPIAEQFIKDGSWVKLREISIGYLLNSEGFRNATGFVDSMEFTLSGRNLVYWSKDDFGQDPETNLTGASNGRGLQYFNNPATRSYLATIKINF
ncbi:SusC/RagA family TonB-linked outer membrane protein [Galbibacter sp. BG1]|uniref:SusC/RagA family TonB-linked outer membrane protein n=1 Tax=Galbibacter sp. BG1 TaxID=1170699 RepID=UPI0015B7E5E3|nr:SusC/RagA family TonB-linked outer membrane protein [Galbibacter sp. BG1]QLE00559.1 SusC/RagA family TonB-linked outer membrane protein [Galbibacter sp. BG1]